MIFRLHKQIIYSVINDCCTQKSECSTVKELTAFFNITDKEILEESKKIFGSGCGYHDSRFDTTAVYLAIKRAVERKVLTGELWKDF